MAQGILHVAGRGARDAGRGAGIGDPAHVTDPAPEQWLVMVDRAIGTGDLNEPSTRAISVVAGVANRVSLGIDSPGTVVTEGTRAAIRACEPSEVTPVVGQD